MWFGEPRCLWGLGAVLLIVAMFVTGWRRRRTFREVLGEDALLQALVHPAYRPTKAGELAFASLTLVLAVLALARPHVLTSGAETRGRSLDLIAVIDVSKSMAAEDYGPHSRLDKAKEALLGLLHQLHPGTRLGLVTFAGASFQQAELTEDFTALKFILQRWVRIESVPLGGSELADALETAVASFENNGRPKLILLLSDGGEWEDHLVTVAQHAQGQGIKILSAGLGGGVPAQIPRYGDNGAFLGYAMQGDQVLTTALNERTLRYLAQTTGGQYVRIQSGKELPALFPRFQADATATIWKQGELFQLFLFLSLLSLAATILTERARLRSRVGPPR